MIIKKHWLHGDIKFNVDVQKEDSCGECIHWQVCRQSKRDFCRNYCSGTSERNIPCDGCVHRFTRYNEDKIIHGTQNKIPCFKCRWFEKDFDNGCLNRPL